MNSTLKPYGLELPPSSNTGAQNTEGARDRRAIIDYAALTFPDGYGPVEVAELLGLNVVDVLPLDRGQNGYRSGIRFGQTRVYFEGNVGMGVHVISSGDACRELEGHHGPSYWEKQHRQVQGAGGHYTRVDVAIDDFTGTLDLGVIGSAPCRSYWKKGRSVIERTLADGRAGGTTLYFGSRTSNAMARFYDKAIEQGHDGPWVRVELELKRDHANTVMDLVAKSMPVGELVAGILRHYLTFVVVNPDDSNRARWDAAPWWDAWLGQVERLRLSSGERQVKTVAQMADWFERQVAPTLATLRRAMGHGRWETWMRRVDSSGARRMRERHHIALAQALA